MEKVLLEYKSKGITKIIFGDIFLEDLRTYRENNLEKIDFVAEFPLWKSNTTELINEFLELNFKTITCCVNDGFLNEENVGVELNRAFVSSLPATVDPCGENGEFHTFCYDGPIFKKPVPFIIGEKVYKPLDVIVEGSKTKGFWFCELKLVV
jgi:diphthamide synthase (EF-2-diphthine--ammonia ligase)